jgi:2-amino-4-hydroxy-6-hydroxymethyldihydropteridine diphosphokinase
MVKILLGLGANLAGPWGAPSKALVHATKELSAAGILITRCSSLYSTDPVGPGRQARYVNAVVAAEGNISPAALLRLVKRIERRAGRRLGRHWGPRPLDIDILDIGGRRLGWPDRRVVGQLILPHPEMHKRAFVLAPLREIAPFWRHPRLGVGSTTLLARLKPAERTQARQILDSSGWACDKQSK